MGERGEVFETADPEQADRFEEIIRDRVNSSPFYGHMGMELTGLGEGWCTFEMPVGRNLWNVGGIVHGGAVTGLADAAAGVALATLLDSRKLPVTVELKINFCVPVKEGVLEATGKVIQKGNTIAICDIEVTLADSLVAKGISTQMVVPRKSGS